jgi:quercetin dioxygenase-like cupin family protein
MTEPTDIHGELPPVIQPPPGRIKRDDAVLRLWGDRESGFVNDWIYLCNTTIQQTVLSLPPGRHFLHSDRFRTVLGADELYYIAKGRFALTNPQSGEVHLAEAGEALWFQKDTWHHGFNCGAEEVVIIEYFSPPGPGGGSQVYSRTRPLLAREEIHYTQDHLLGRWPHAINEANASDTQHLVTRETTRWRLEGIDDPMLVGIFFSTNNMTTGRAELRPGQETDERVHGGDAVGYVLSGRLNIFMPGEAEAGRSDGDWHEMHATDGFFIPAGTTYRYFNIGDEPVHFVFAVAKNYVG